MKTPKLCKYFSIVEVVVVSAVIAILASLIMSASSSIREAGKKTTCLNNLKQIQAVYEAYRKDHRKSPEGDKDNHDDFSFAKDYVDMSDLDMFVCPGDEAVSQLTSYADLVGGTSYHYVPATANNSSYRKDGYELASTEEVDLESLELVFVDRDNGNHNGNRNIVYLHGSGNSKSGIAQTVTVVPPGTFIKEVVLADKASVTKEVVEEGPVSQPVEEKTFVDGESAFDDYINSVNADTDMTLEEYLANAKKSEVKKWEDVIYTESDSSAFEGGYTTEAITGTLVEGKSSDPQVSAIYSTDGLVITAYSDADLINVVLEYSDGAIEKFEGLPGTQVTVWGTGDNEGKIIANVWIRAGENTSGDGPDFGEYLRLDITGNNGWGNGDQTATGNSLENNNAENDTDGQTHQIHGEANPN
ncbi:hypothetical protein PQO01_19240 [Lentisphaera marina]|uniref:type II secretion system protein n=1 Tax=Lentisphaera marina TaxID=1111041 RepID=UPI002365782D|nr:hypothetical protein [Lentisphaera marina]MDD7987091.1 hypothetical protein [Lentisphaera marina]